MSRRPSLRGSTLDKPRPDKNRRGASTDRSAASPQRVTGALSERMAERARAQRNVRIRKVAVVVVVALLVAGAGYLTLLSPVLALRADDVRVAGTGGYVPADQVDAIVDAAEGTPLLRLDTRGMQAELESLVGVESATVARDLPNGLTITLTPRVPVATVEEDGSFAVMDGHGIELGRADAAIEGMPQVQVPLGTDETADSLAAVLAALGELPPDVLAQVTEASARTPHEIRFQLAAGSQVLWGSASDSALKARVLQTLLQREAQVYDVSAPRNPTTR